jgi:hypothetical protein
MDEPSQIAITLRPEPNEIVISSEASYPSLRMQTTNLLRHAAGLRDLIEVPLAFELFPADAMCFIPVKFSQLNTAIS